MWVMTTASTVIGRNISEFLSPGALANALSVLEHVASNKIRFLHIFIMRVDDWIINRIITLFPSDKKEYCSRFHKKFEGKTKKKNRNRLLIFC